MTKTTILVSGAAGFIGFHVVRKLLNEGFVVIGLDNINDYYDVNLKYGRLRETGIEQSSIKYGEMVQSTKYHNYRFIKANLEDRQAIENLFSTEKINIVCHLAAQAGVRYSIENPHTYIDSNIVGLLNILECCRHNKIEHLVYASSSSVYGMNSKIPFSENDRVDHPVSLYAATKKSNELMAYTYSHLYQLPTTGLRFFTVYGPWGRPDMAPMLFATAISEGKSIKVFNNGDMKRDFTYIDDIVEGIVLTMKVIPNKNSETPFCSLFNIGNSQPVALMDFIQTLEDCMGRKAKMEMYPMQAGDVKITYADTTKLEQATGYKPNTSLKDGINCFAKWYKNYYK
ncbi:MULTISPECIES: NAD-dependent epimerase [unclassified Dysgonomonas]|uniref:NAD-dependent epimerase n=1 Tax=unclassified Dysgonomonas TaxID=2630389 RepID=UPI0024741226|nr:MULTISPECIES: NAD-dependent epimerase [unclassified Dysgonomonas]